jgi:hypothetical protein
MQRSAARGATGAKGQAFRFPLETGPAQSPAGRIIRIDPARSIRAGRGMGAVKPAAAGSAVLTGMDAVTTGSGVRTARPVTEATGALIFETGRSFPDDRTRAWPPAIQKAAAAAIAHTASATLGDINPREVNTVLLPANTPSRSPRPVGPLAKSRGMGPSASGCVIRDLNTPPAAPSRGRVANTSRGAETGSKQASSTSRLGAASSFRLRSGINRSPAPGSIACVARLETPMRHPFSTPALQKALKHPLPNRKWK